MDGARRGQRSTCSCSLPVYPHRYAYTHVAHTCTFECADVTLASSPAVKSIGGSTAVLMPASHEAPISGLQVVLDVGVERIRAMGQVDACARVVPVH